MKNLIINSLLYLLILTPIISQESTVKKDTSQTNSFIVGDIVVSASKDNFKLKEKSASVSILSSRTILENRINNLTDISATVPNLFMPDYGSKLTSPIYIRGIGSRINSPSVGLYVDFVPYFEKAAFNFDFFDIEKIEVIRGPQGTQYGRNTMGGIVNVITKSPLESKGSTINFSAGSYGLYNINAAHYGKTSNNFAYSLAANYNHNDGFFTNKFNSKKVDKLNSYSFRNRLVYQASSELTFENIASFENSKQGGYPYAIYNDITKKAIDINYNDYSSYDRDLFSNAFLIKHQTDFYDVISTTSFQYLKDRQEIDQDFTPRSLVFVTQDQKHNMISQEIIFRSTVDNSNYNFLFGVYGFVQNFKNGVNVNNYIKNEHPFKAYDHTIKGYAVFHQSSFNNLILDNLTLTAGIRLDGEKDDMKYFNDIIINNSKTILADTTYPALNSFEVIPKLALNYKLFNSNLYILASKGYKTGGFNSTFERPEDLTFNPEFSWNYEFGIKTSIPNWNLYFDLAFFYIDWKNQQIYQTVPSGNGSMLKNAGHSSSKGIEITTKSILPADIDLEFSYGYTYAKFLSHIVNENLNYNGNYIPYVPKHTFSIQAGKTFLVNSFFVERMRFNVIYRGNGEIYWNEKNSHKQDYYGMLDAKIAFFGSFWQFDIWGKNLLSTEYQAFYFEALGNKYVQMGKPLQIGINFTLSF